jgi:hypothetical protein
VIIPGGTFEVATIHGDTDDGMGGFSKKLHDADAKTSIGLEGEGAKCVNWAVRVRIVRPALAGFTKRRSVARGASSSLTKIGWGERVDVRDVTQPIARFQADMAVHVPASRGASLKVCRTRCSSMPDC